ncbi:MAG: hypothetical protein EU541_08195 [Promethearchaeota archaeon]|nr:MAG: hypothetical protein EU541_08195 [Candidatus Lokiarchaeota archaeon]
MKKLALIKLGGSILEDQGAISSTIGQLNFLLRNRIFKNIIIITGGGSYANFIRYIDTKLDLEDDLAHWEAIISMDKNAEDLHQKFPSTLLCENLSDLYNLIDKKSTKSNLIIFKPFNYLYESDILPHSWMITSDSIALHFSYKFQLEKCFLIKNIDGIIHINGNTIPNLTVKEFKTLKETNKFADIGENNNLLKKKTTPIDPYSLKLIERYGIPCIILNGTSSQQRIKQYFNKNSNQISTTIFPTKKN